MKKNGVLRKRDRSDYDEKGDHEERTEKDHSSQLGQSNQDADGATKKGKVSFIKPVVEYAKQEELAQLKED